MPAVYSPTVAGGWVAACEADPPGLFTLDTASWVLSRYGRGWRVVWQGCLVGQWRTLADAETAVARLQRGE